MTDRISDEELRRLLDSISGKNALFIPFDVYCDVIDATPKLIAELLALRAAQAGWQPIETAPPPKDHPFLGRNPGMAAFIAEWLNSDGQYLTFDSADGWIRMPFTHWMAIPALAQPDGGEGAA